MGKSEREMKITLITTKGGLALLIATIILFMCVMGALSGIILAEIFL